MLGLATVHSTAVVAALQDCSSLTASTMAQWPVHKADMPGMVAATTPGCAAPTTLLFMPCQALQLHGSTCCRLHWYLHRLYPVRHDELCNTTCSALATAATGTNTAAQHAALLNLPVQDHLISLGWTD